MESIFFSGNYHLGLSETAVFYPLNFLFLLLPQVDTWVVLIIIEPIIAGVGMYLFLKRVVLRNKSAVFGALAFAFSGIVIVRSVEGLSVGHALIWTPYVFWGIESFFQTKKIRFLLVMLFSLCFASSPKLSGRENVLCLVLFFIGFILTLVGDILFGVFVNEYLEKNGVNIYIDLIWRSAYVFFAFGLLIAGMVVSSVQSNILQKISKK